MKKASKKSKNATEFDAYFEDHDIADLLEIKPVRINVDLPASILLSQGKSSKTA